MSLCDAPGSCQAPVIDEFGDGKTLLCFPHQAKLVIATKMRMSPLKSQRVRTAAIEGVSPGQKKCVTGVNPFKKHKYKSLMTSWLSFVAW